MNLDKKLENLGLNQKESKVYIALLELGQASAQEVSSKTALNRATTYVILESLIKKELVRNLIRKKKTFFTVESPLQIIEMLNDKQKDISSKLDVAKEIMPELEMLCRVTSQKAKVKFYEGKEGVLMIQKDLFKEKPRIVEEIFNLNNTLDVFPPSPADHRKKSDKKKIKVRSIAIYDPKKIVPKLPLLYKEERKYLPYNKFPFNADFSIYKNKVVLLSWRKKIMGIVIENKDIADAMRSLFTLAWSGAEKYIVLKKEK